MGTGEVHGVVEAEDGKVVFVDVILEVRMDPVRGDEAILKRMWSQTTTVCPGTPKEMLITFLFLEMSI